MLDVTISKATTSVERINPECKVALQNIIVEFCLESCLYVMNIIELWAKFTKLIQIF